MTPNDILVTPAMITAGKEALARCGARADSDKVVCAIYMAMALKAPNRPGSGKAEAPPEFEGAPDNVVQLPPRR